MSFIVAIDGTAGSGKGTVAERVSQKLELVNIGTGSAYRCVALEIINRKLDVCEKEKIIEILSDINIDFKLKDSKDEVYLNGVNVTDRIRHADVTKIVAQVSNIIEVRKKLNDMFRSLAKGKDVLMEGRDIGTCVFPNADVKIYIDATVEERAKRRYAQNQEKGIDMSFEEICENLKLRDKSDKEKEYGALKKADDAIYIDTTDLTIDEVCDKVIKLINDIREGN
jgi:cytidylate kinase